MLSYKRSVRVAELLQQEISKIIQELRTPELGFVTVTGVKLTDDLQESRVFYSVIGSKEQVARSGELLREMLPEIRHQVALRVNLRRTPTIELIYDDTAEKASRIFELLNRIHDEEKVAGSTPAQPPEKKAKAAAHKKKIIKKAAGTGSRIGTGRKAPHSRPGSRSETGGGL